MGATLATERFPQIQATWERGLWLVGAGLALVLRLLVVLLSRHSYTPVFDAADFNRIAISIAHGHGFGPPATPGLSGASAFRTPLFPALLGLVYAIFGVHVLVARFVMAIISTAAVLSIGLLANRMAGRTVGLICVWLAAVYPPLILAGYGLNYEVLYITLACSSLITAIDWTRRPERWWLLALSGILIGLVALCRETGLLLLIPVWIMVVVASRRRTQLARLARNLVVVTACAAVVVVPWTIRNAVDLHGFIPISDSPGEALAGEYNATTAHDGSKLARWIVPVQDPADLAKIQALGPRPTEEKYTSTLERAGLDYLRAHPSTVPRVVAGNTVRLFALRGFHDAVFYAPFIGWSPRFVKVSVLGFWLVAVLAIIGLFTTEFRRTPKSVWVFPVLLYVVLALTVGIDQYRIPMDPFFLILAAMAVAAGYGRWSRRAIADG